MPLTEVLDCNVTHAGETVGQVKLEVPQDPEIGLEDTYEPPIHPTWARVLVRPLKVSESDKTFKNSQIIIPDEAMAREQRAQTKAILVAIGGDCFMDWNTRGPIPQIGDTVFVEKYVGFHIKHNDVDYQLINDDQILAVLGEE